MLEIRIHGLGGQGVVTAANTLALACFYEGWQTQAFPFFGPERIGAPVCGFVRLSRQVIKLKQQIYRPDIIIVFDDNLLTKKINFADGAKTDTKLLINSQLDRRQISRLTKMPPDNIIILSAPHRDQADNLLLIGYAVKKFNLSSLSNYLRAVKEQLADKEQQVIENNLKIARSGYEQ